MLVIIGGFVYWFGGSLFFFTLLFFVLSFFFPFLLSCVADRVLALRPHVRPKPPTWESQVQDIGPPGTSQPHVISIGERSPKRSPPQDKDPTPPNGQQAPVLDALGQTTNKTGIQPHSLAQRLCKVILSSQTPQNTQPDTDQPTRRTRSSPTQQNTGTSPLHQESYTSHWTNLTHWGQTPKTVGTMNLKPAKRKPQTQ